MLFPFTKILLIKVTILYPLKKVNIFNIAGKSVVARGRQPRDHSFYI
jgi:hypothetical protein